MEDLFFNTAAISRISKVTAQKMSEAVLALAEGSPDIRNWILSMERCRRLGAQLLGAAGPECVGFLLNTSQAISAAAEGISWDRGDEIIVPNVEYPANQYPWLNLERKGVVVVRAEPNPFGGVEWEDFEPYISKKTKLIAFSHVQFMTGYYCDIERIAKECQALNILTLVDAIQSAGVLPLEMEKWGVDFMVCGSQKWIQGPPGIGMLAVNPALLQKIHPVFTGAFSVKNPLDVTDIDLTFHEDGHRFETGTMNFLGFVGLEQALKESIEDRGKTVRSNAELLRKELLQRGMSLLGGEKKENTSGIITFTHSTIAMELLFEQLTSQGIVSTFRLNTIRIAPERGTTPETIQKFLEILDRYI